MGLWDKLFGGQQTAPDSLNSIHDKIIKFFPRMDEEEQVIAACVAGLYTRVAFVDLKVCTKETEHITKSLEEWLGYSHEKAEIIAAFAIEEVQDLAGLENHLYTKPLNEFLSKEERYKVIEGLFFLAASDGEASNLEVNEINHISQSLLLEQREFVQAKMGVLDKIGALKS